MNSIIRRTILAAALVAIAGSAPGCSSGDNPTLPEVTVAPQPAPAAPATPPPKPKRVSEQGSGSMPDPNVSP
jgi:hypothetical protein